MVVTREVCDKDLREIQHVRGKAGQFRITNKLQVECQTMPKRGNGEGRDEEGTICLGCRQFNVCYSLYERPDITFVVGEISRYISNLGREY